MPKNVLPEAARVLPKAGQAVWMKAFNDALDQGLSEEEASKIGWAAVKRAGYSKNSGGKWSKSMENDFAVSEDGMTFEFSAPLMKVNVHKRIVEGFATLDNVDQASDRVSAEASAEAFGDWFGNIREMHQKKAVGKAIDWRLDTYTDEDGNTYEGVWVTAKISKGAEDTWQKVLDGTLAGFSIGGATLEKKRDIVKDADGNSRQIWTITKYRLTELSLVDNPCNRLATISLIKSVDGEIEFDDTIADGEVEKSWDGEKCEFVDLSASYQSVVTALENLRDDAIRNNADDVVADASYALSSFRRKKRYEQQEAEYHSNNVNKSEEDDMSENSENETQGLQKNEESAIPVVELTEEDKSLFKKFVDFIKGNEAPAVSGAEALNTEEEGETPEMNAEDFAKAIDDVKDELTKSVDSKFDEVGESLTKITDLLEKVATVDAVDELKKEFTAQIDELVGRLEVVENSGGVKKSGEDAGDAGEKIEKSDEGFWADSILPSFVKDAR